jgi:hypothetical protein
MTIANRLVAAAASCGAVVLGGCAERAEPSVRDAPVEQRNQLLMQAIRDAGYLCDEIIDSTSPPVGDSVWRVLCSDMLVYVASLDSADVFHIEPIPYGDPGPFPVIRNPDNEPERDGPDP